MTDTIRDMLQYYNSKSPANAQRRFPNAYDEMVRLTAFLPVDSPYRQREFHIMNDITLTPGCKVCGAPVKWNVRDRKYASFCSNSCAVSDTEYHQKRKQTIKQKYGVEYFSQHEKFAEKHRQTCLNRYGVEHHNQIKHNVDAIQQTKLHKYGRINHSQSHIDPATIELLDDPMTIRSLHHDEQLTLSAIADKFNVSLTAIRERCYSFGIEIRRYFSSMAERELVEYINTLIPDEVLTRCRSVPGVSELDVYIPSKNIAFEYNGLYWHCEDRKPRTHLIRKTQLCKKQGIKLIHIFENEWKSKRHIVQSRIAAILGCCKKIPARKCTVSDITPREAKDFLDSNHLQGNCSASIRLGLWYEQELVAVMTFGKSRYSKNGIELIRYCSKRNTSVVGGAKKLLTAFERQHDCTDIISYCDLRWGDGNMYKQLGFDWSHDSTPNYWYFKTSGTEIVVLSRIQCQKHKLAKMLSNFDPLLSEFDNMTNAGYLRVWDCGNAVFTRKLRQ